jgi:hypothetical protein
MGGILKNLLAENYNARFLCDIINTKPTEFLVNTMKIIRDEENVRIFFLFNNILLIFSIRERLTLLFVVAMAHFLHLYMIFLKM